MPIDYSPLTKRALSSQIAEALGAAITSGELRPDDRLPSEAELSERFDVSRATVREALKRLAAQNLISTRRGATGGAFVKRLSWDDAYGQMVTMSTLLISMHAVDFETVCEARFTQERACMPLAAKRREQSHLERMQQELEKQADPALSDEDFCASDVAFHRALVDGACNPVLAFQMAGAVETMQPLMNMITFRNRDRSEILNHHKNLLSAITARDSALAITALDSLAEYTATLAARVAVERAKRKPSESAASG